MTDTEAIKVCPVDGEPVVFTFEFPKAEYYCPTCGWLGGMFAPKSAEATPQLLARQDEICIAYELARAERTGQPAPQSDPDAVRPTCNGCGKTAEGHLIGGKPPHWFTRTKDGEKQYACSRACITEGAVLPL